MGQAVRGRKRQPLVMVNVLAHDLKLCLAQWPASEKRYEPGVLRERLGQPFESYPGLRLLTMDALYAERDLCQAMVSCGRDYMCGSRGTGLMCWPPWLRGLPTGNWGSLRLRPWEKAGVIERRSIWTDAALAEYVREELGFPGARQGVMVEKEMVDVSTGEVSRERWYLLTSLSSRQYGPRGLHRVVRNHWSVENSLHHVKDRSWDEDVHTLRRPGLGEVYATLVNTALNTLRLEGWFPVRMSMVLRAKTCAFRPAQTIARLLGQAFRTMDGTACRPACWPRRCCCRPTTRSAAPRPRRGPTSTSGGKACPGHDRGSPWGLRLRTDPLPRVRCRCSGRS